MPFLPSLTSLVTAAGENSGDGLSPLLDDRSEAPAPGSRRSAPDADSWRLNSNVPIRSDDGVASAPRTRIHTVARSSLVVTVYCHRWHCRSRRHARRWPSPVAELPEALLGADLYHCVSWSKFTVVRPCRLELGGASERLHCIVSPPWLPVRHRDHHGRQPGDRGRVELGTAPARTASTGLEVSEAVSCLCPRTWSTVQVGPSPSRLRLSIAVTLTVTLW